MKKYVSPSVEEIRLTSMEAITSGQPGIESGNGSDADF